MFFLLVQKLFIECARVEVRMYVWRGYHLWNVFISLNTMDFWAKDNKFIDKMNRILRIKWNKMERIVWRDLVPINLWSNTVQLKWISKMKLIIFVSLSLILTNFNVSSSAINVVKKIEKASKAKKTIHFIISFILFSSDFP